MGRLLRSLPARRRLALVLREWAGCSKEAREAALGKQAARELYASRPRRPVAQGSAQDRVLAEIEAAGSTRITRNRLRKRLEIPAAQLAGIVNLLTQQQLISVGLDPAICRPMTRYRALASTAGGRAA